MSAPQDHEAAEAPKSRRFVLGQRTVFDWVFVVLAIGGTWSASAKLSQIQHQLDAKVSHYQFMRWTVRAVQAEKRGETLPIYVLPDDRTDGEEDR